MAHQDLYPDMDPDYTTRVFYARRELLSTVESSTILPENGLNSRGLLDDGQLNKVREIRTRRLQPVVLERFAAD